MRFLWYPPNGDSPIDLDEDPYIIQEISGLGSTQSDPRLTKGPGQIGESGIDVAVGPRVITMRIVAHAGSEQEIFEARNQLSRSMLSLPVRDAEDPERGVFSVQRAGLEDVEIEAWPRNSPREMMRGPRHALYDIELVCPDPYWRETADQAALLVHGEGGGFVFPLEHPFEMESLNVQVELLNEGDVRVPVQIRMYGECTNPRLRNQTTGREIGLNLELGADEYVEIQTAFGRKSITFVDAGGRSNLMSALDLERADFWELEPGPNTVIFEASSNISGQATMAWREKVAGI